MPLTNNTSSQKELVLNHLIMIGSLSDDLAFKLYKIKSLSKVISKLRKKQHSIKTFTVNGQTRYKYDTHTLPLLNDSISNEISHFNDKLCKGFIFHDNT